MCKLTSSSISTEQKEEVTNQKWILTQRPQGAFNPETDVEMVVETIQLQDCDDDEVIIETDTLSVDAFVRTMLDEDAFHGTVELGTTLPAMGYGKVVVAGQKSGYQVGTYVQGMMGAQTYGKVKANAFLVRKFDFPFLSPTASLGVMGLTTGLTAYAGMFFCLGRPKRRDTVVITAAAGAVGSIASQLAKWNSPTTAARVIGVAGGEAKQQYLTEELKLDGVINYKHPTKSVADQLTEVCPDGIDFVFDNVGGEILDDLLLKINPKGRIVVCGAISQYHKGNVNNGTVRGPSNYLQLASRGATMRGFVVMEYGIKLVWATLRLWYLSLRGKLVMKEHVEEGIDRFPGALNMLFTGGHIGKLLVKVKTNK
mmetsp:Transcript_16944/g.25637  ORF Transcript_16944/g.25637 Transcript_16944/m.25637 type:complete len:369 (-) Transcript_16944:64-1170(-)